MFRSTTLSLALALLTSSYLQADIFIPTSGTDTILSTSGDDFYLGPYALGFTFNFNGIDYTEAYMSSNGHVSFGSGSADRTQWATNVPDIAPFLDDLFLPTGDLRLSTGTGVAAFTWNGVAVYSEGGLVTAQAALFGAGNSYGYTPGSVVLSYGQITQTYFGEMYTGLHSGSGVLATHATLAGGTNDGRIAEPESYLLSGRQFLYSPTGPGSFSVLEINAVPEPSSLLLLSVTALAGLCFRRYRSNSKT